VPVQFSCHGLAGDGALTHHEWIADGPDDPRPALAAALVEACSDARTVVAYNARFERRCIDDLADAVPGLADELRDITERLADLLPVVRDHVYHPDFHGSFSLKAVLPALVPGSGYADLEVAEGATASAELDRLLFRADTLTPGERGHLRDALLRYCALDTLAMVRLLDRLRELA
jgi:predicted RecB family nuclease